MKRLCNVRNPLFDRRQVLQYASCGFGWLAFASLATRDALATHANSLDQTHFPAKAKRVIFLCMRGGPSHVDTFDYKPNLAKDDGKAGPKAGSKFMKSPWKFSQHGKSGLWISELFPQVAKHADKLCMIHSMSTDVPAHPQAMVRLHTGNSQFVRPSIGAWTLYGLGTANENLPGFVSIAPPAGFGGAQNYGSAFLPAIYQGTRIGNEGRTFDSATLPNLSPLTDRASQKNELDFIQSMNKQKKSRDKVNPEVDGVIESYELAFKMQADMPKVLNIDSEPQTIQRMYGVNNRTTNAFAKKCILARRLVEAGVRFVEVTHGNWDHHQQIQNALPNSCESVDQPIGALLADLEQRGMLKDTLVVWTGEFGRTPYAQGRDGRDHNNKAFTTWMAGGGVKGGLSYGSSGEHGIEAAEDPVPMVDFHATMLALLGLDHERLTYHHAGRDFRLTDVKGRIVRELIA